jgi:DNA-binding PadR family transcriptional regulator
MPSKMDTRDELAFSEKLSQELRRGTLVLAVLSQLKAPTYGYALLEHLSGQGLQIEQGTLYPLLRRLEEQGLLESEWNVEGPRPRRYYVISRQGSKALEDLTEEWSQLAQALASLLAS